MNPILETKKLSMHFGGVTALHKVDFSLDPGELRCLIGPNGAGKSTFFKILCGQLKSTEGNVIFGNSDITHQSPHKISKAGIGIKTQVPSVYDGLSIRENITLSAWRTKPKKQAYELADKLIEEINLTEISHQTVGRLAHGQRQRVELAMVLAQEPQLLLFDEPTACMTVEEVKNTAKIIKNINKNYSMIVVEHDMKFIRMIADKVTVFHQGKILAEDKVESVMKNKMVRDVYLGKQTDGSNF